MSSSRGAQRGPADRAPVAAPRPEPRAAEPGGSPAGSTPAEVLLAIARRALTAPDNRLVLRDAAALLVEALGADLAAVAETTPGGRSLVVELAGGPAATAGPRPSSCEVALAGSDSLAAHALSVAHTVVVEDLAEEQGFTDLFLRRHGARSAIAVPLKAGAWACGALAILCRQPRAFDPQQVACAETAGHLLAMACARSRAESSLARQGRRFAGLLDTLDAMVIVADPQWQVVELNRAAERVTGFKPRELRQRAVLTTLIAPEDAEEFQRRAGQPADHGAPACFETTLLTKHLKRRRILWSTSLRPDEDGRPAEILLTGIDVTAWREAEQAAAAAQPAGGPVRAAPAYSGTPAILPDADPDAAAVPADASFARGAAGLPRAATERRGRPRRPYPYTQRVAPILDGKLPASDQFADVLCHDIAAGGFSFLADTPPPADSLVVALGADAKVIYLTAQVAHVTRLKRPSGPRYLIGCTYTGRANYAEPSQAGTSRTEAPRQAELPEAVSG